MITEIADPVQTEAIAGPAPLSPSLQFVNEQTAIKALRDFVEVVYEPDDIIEPRPCLEGRKGGKPSWCLAADMEQKFECLRLDNAQGWHIYVGANPRNAFGASGNANVLLARCLYADFDGGCTADEAIKRIKTAGLPLPTMLVNSGGGIHAWWRLHEPISDLAAFTVLQERLAATLKSDSGICNAERIMRLPGFLNCKAKYGEPRLVTIIESDPRRRHSLTELAVNLVDVEKKPEPWTPPLGWTQRAAEQDDHAHIMNTLNKIPGGTEGGQSGTGRNSMTFKAAAMLVKDFALPIGEARTYLATFNLGNRPPLEDRELDDVLESAMKNGKHALGQKLGDKQDSPQADLSQLLADAFRQPTVGAQAFEPQIERVAEPQAETEEDPSPQIDKESAAYRKAFDSYPPLPEGTWQPKPLTSAEFARADFRQEYLIKGVLARGQPFIIGGPAKALKTMTSVELAISLGMENGKFLGQFEVLRPSRVLVLSGESGEATIKDAARRICDSKGIELSDANVIWDFSLPRVSSDQDMIQLSRVIQAYGCDVTIIDPAYLCLLAGGDGRTQAGNVLQMGPLLGRLTALAKGTGSTIGLNHHTIKRLESPNEPPMLADLSMAGFMEWARQWLLLGRREEYREGTGHHKLWLRAGGSAGHSGLYGVDVDEGELTDDPNSRRWEVFVHDGHGLRDAEKARKAEAKAEYKKKQEHGKLVALTLAAANYLRDIPEGDTKSAIKDALGCTVKDRDIVLAMLIESGDVIEPLILKGNHKTPREGYKWVGKANRSEQSEQSESSREAVGKTG